MCTPGKDEIIKQVRHYLDEANTWILRQHKGVDRSSLPCWTLPVKRALFKACQEAHRACNPGVRCRLHLRASSMDGNCKHVAGANAPGPADAWLYDNPPHEGEWLWDVTCLTYDGNCLKKALLVAESEFTNAAEVLKDFRKLLVARAEVRIMVHDRLCKMPFATLEKHVRQYDGNQPGDTYLLAAFTCHCPQQFNQCQYRGAPFPLCSTIDYYRVDVDPTLNVQGMPL